MYRCRSKDRFKKYENENLLNYQGHNHFIYQTPVFKFSTTSFQAVAYLNFLSHS